MTDTFPNTYRIKPVLNRGAYFVVALPGQDFKLDSMFKSLVDAEIFIHDAKRCVEKYGETVVNDPITA